MAEIEEDIYKVALISFFFKPPICWLNLGEDKMMTDLFFLSLLYYPHST